MPIRREMAEQVGAANEKIEKEVAGVLVMFLSADPNNMYSDTELMAELEKHPDYRNWEQRLAKECRISRKNWVISLLSGVLARLAFDGKIVARPINLIFYYGIKY